MPHGGHSLESSLSTDLPLGVHVLEPHGPTAPVALLHLPWSSPLSVDRAVDDILDRGATPWVCLAGHDAPSLSHWHHREAVPAFVDRASQALRLVGDRVHTWLTHHAPPFADRLGEVPRASRAIATDPFLAAAHHVLLAHGRVAELLRTERPSARVGISLHLVPGTPASDSEADAVATVRHDQRVNRWFLDPLAGLGYPDEAVRRYRHVGRLPVQGPIPFVAPGDMETIATPIDFLGVAYRTRRVLRSQQIPEVANVPSTVRPVPPHHLDPEGREAFPAGMYDILMSSHAGRPTVLTEVGLRAPAVSVADHLDQVRRARRDGVDVRRVLLAPADL